MSILGLFSVLIFSFFSTKAFGETYFSPNNCEFSVSFPSHYEAQYGYGPSGARFDREISRYGLYDRYCRVNFLDR